MFSFCKNLKDLNISNFIINNRIDKTNNLFIGCNKLQNINIIQIEDNK